MVAKAVELGYSYTNTNYCTIKVNYNEHSDKENLGNRVPVYVLEYTIIHKCNFYIVSWVQEKSLVFDLDYTVSQVYRDPLSGSSISGRKTTGNFLIFSITFQFYLRVT